MDEVFEALVEEYYLESRERLSQIEDALLSLDGASADAREELLVLAKRELHTLKGNSGMMGLADLQQLAHELEDKVVALEDEAGLREILTGVDRFRRMLARACKREEDVPAESGEGADDEVVGAALQESVRVAFSSLDSLVDLLSEMVIFRNRLNETLSQGLATLTKDERHVGVWSEVETARQTLHRTLDDLQAGIMHLRMVPLGSFFAQLKRIVFDESANEGKEVQFHTSGGDTPLDKALLEVASEAIGHLVRNAIVHGLESPEERRAAGKSTAGHLTIAATAQADEVVIDIEDDGRGVDRAALLAIARKRGISVPDNIDLQTLLSMPGLSTKEAADRSAGRGMGMAAVMESVRRRGGQVEIFSSAGRGTRFRLRLPLTAAILRALVLRVDEQLYALPLVAVQESMSLATEARHTMNQAGVLRWRRHLVPLLDLGLAFGTSSEPRQDGYVVMIEAEGRLRGIVIDELAGIQDVVVKGLDEVVGEPRGLAGCTILGDGTVILILDPTGLVNLSPFVEQAV